jgi:hypothetical protein
MFQKCEVFFGDLNLGVWCLPSRFGIDEEKIGWRRTKTYQELIPRYKSAISIDNITGL